MAWATIEEMTQAVRGQTAPQLFLRTIARHRDVIALRADGAVDGAVREWTYGEYGDLVARAAAGFLALGVRPGERVLLMMRNRPDFHWFDTAAQFVRATPVSIYNSSSPEEVQYLAHHAEARIAIVEDAGFLERILQIRGELPHLQRIFTLEDTAATSVDIADAAGLLDHGRADLQALADATDPSDLATLIYTSGTTGPPKGVMLDQANIVYTVEQLCRCFGPAAAQLAGKRVVSYLPMAHIAERMMSHYQAMVHGLSITCCPDATQLAPTLREVRPQVMFGVPRVWEKIHNGVNAAIALDPDKQTRFEEGLALALEIKRAERSGTATKEQLDTWAFLDAVAFSTVRSLVGIEELEIAVSGAAPIPQRTLEWFRAIGVPISEIYGMSESSGPMTWEAYAVRPGTVGPPIPGCEVRIADDGEVLCRGGNVFRGYLKDPAKTGETLVDGWLHSGDIGVMDADGYLRIVDRKKELIITAGGKNISPANLESALRTIPLVGQACAIGDNRKYCTALLVLDPEYAPVWATANGIEGLTLEELAAHPDVIAEVQLGVDDVNERFAAVERIKRFLLLGEEWMPDSDILTPTAKLKRRGIHARYATAIESLYD